MHPEPYESRSTLYGNVVIGRTSVEIYANARMLWDWAHRPGFSWPCSTLVDLDDEVIVWFDSNGLCDMQPSDADIMGDELSAWASDVLGLAGLSESHPAYFVTVGQFKA